MMLNNKNITIEKYSNKFSSRQIINFDRISSTQIVARNLAKKNEPDKTVITASSQFCGKGRMNRDWESIPERGLYFSMILHPETEPLRVPQLSLLTAVALVSSIRNTTGLNVKIKWPNDVMYEGKKIGGILSEARFVGENTEYVIIGVGVNVNQRNEDFSNLINDKASSLFLNTNKEFDLKIMFHAFLDSFDYWYDEWCSNGVVRIINAWNKYNCTIGKNINLVDDTNILCSGLAVAVDSNGCLIVKDEAGCVMSFNYGEVSILMN